MALVAGTAVARSFVVLDVLDLTAPIAGCYYILW